MRILVNGLLPHDSGKTTMASSLIRVFRNLGYDVGFCKPISGINGWYQFKCIEESLKLGFLVGEDLIKLHKACESGDDLRVEGVVVSVVFPPDPIKVDFRTDYYSVHNPAVVRIYEDHYYFPSSLKLLSKEVSKVVERMIERFKAEKHDDFNELFEEGLRFARKCFKTLRHEVTIIESYNNVAKPVEIECDYVLSVMPCRAVLIDGKDFEMATNLTHLNTTERVLEVVKPVEVFEVPPMRSEETAKNIVKFLLKD